MRRCAFSGSNVDAKVGQQIKDQVRAGGAAEPAKGMSEG